MKAVASVLSLLCVCAVFGKAHQPAKPSGEEGRIIALESAWDQAEQNKDANALANLLAENLVYVDYDGSISTKQQFLAQVKGVDVTGNRSTMREWPCICTVIMWREHGNLPRQRRGKR